MAHERYSSVKSVRVRHIVEIHLMFKELSMWKLTTNRLSSVRSVRENLTGGELMQRFDTAVPAPVVYPSLEFESDAVQPRFQ
jgi:hypothetical protein